MRELAAKLIAAPSWFAPHLPTSFPSQSPRADDGEERRIEVNKGCGPCDDGAQCAIESLELRKCAFGGSYDLSGGTFRGLTDLLHGHSGSLAQVQFLMNRLWTIIADILGFIDPY